MESFRADLCAALRDIGQLQPLFPRAHFLVREALLERAKHKTFVSKDGFERLCQEHKVPKDERTDLLNFLDILGEIIHFPKLHFLDS